jgi:2,3-bisphosphoglycerate-independent phosphoglycerate mutase
MRPPLSPMILVILDGFGERAETENNAIALAQTPNIDALRATCPWTLIQTSGVDVGLPPGQMGNSEVGHLNFGAGRIAMMELSRIDHAVHEKSFNRNGAIRKALDAAKRNKSTLHLLGLLSDGGVHSSIDHLFGLLEVAKDEGIPVVVHAFLDGRDVAPGTAPSFIAQLESCLQGAGKIGTVSGRYYAMDRDDRWERIEKTYRAIVFGNHPAPRISGLPMPGPSAPLAGSALKGIQRSYDDKKTDEFVEPFAVADYGGVMPGDVAIFTNFRPDRARELTAALALEQFSKFDRSAEHAPFEVFVCMASYDASMPLPVAFPRETYPDLFGEVVSRAGLAQFRCAETEKYAHVTYFFNGGHEAAFPGEDRKVVPSPKDVATYDRRPEMSVEAVAKEVCQAIESGKYAFILVNFANPDMVGHSGVLEAAIAAVEAVDESLGKVVASAKKVQATLFVTSDHGNAELMRDPITLAPHTSHTTNPVPFIVLSPQTVALRSGGRIADVAPTMLQVLGIAQPAAMTGVSLLEQYS